MNNEAKTRATGPPFRMQGHAALGSDSRGGHVGHDRRPASLPLSSNGLRPELGLRVRLRADKACRRPAAEVRV